MRVPVGDDPADRHGVAQVVVGHERHAVHRAVSVQTRACSAVRSSGPSPEYV